MMTNKRMTTSTIVIRKCNQSKHEKNNIARRTFKTNGKQSTKRIYEKENTRLKTLNQGRVYLLLPLSYEEKVSGSSWRRTWASESTFSNNGSLCCLCDASVTDFAGLQISAVVVRQPLATSHSIMDSQVCLEWVSRESFSFLATLPPFVQREGCALKSSSQPLRVESAGSSVLTL